MRARWGLDGPRSVLLSAVKDPADLVGHALRRWGPGVSPSVRAERERDRRLTRQLRDRGVKGWLSHADSVTMMRILNDLPVATRPTPLRSGPIVARVWLAVALASGGRYSAPEADGHPAELQDGGPTVDSILLMAAVQRHTLVVAADGWEDGSLSAALGTSCDDMVRVQGELDVVAALIRHPAPLGDRWWRARASGPSEN